MKRKLEIELLTIGYLKDYYDISDLNHILYYSPEIMQKIEKNDITREFPFNGSTKEEIFNKIKNEKIDFFSPKLNSVSDEYKDIL